MMILNGGEPALQPLKDQVSFPFVTQVKDAEQADVVFRWGTAVAEPPGVTVLNPLRAALRAVHARSMRELLALHGIKASDIDQKATRYEDGSAYAHEYVVPVFHLQPLALFERKRHGHLLLQGTAAIPSSSTFVETALPPVSFPARRAVRQAVRAVYALGLDFAEVRIGITPAGRTLVLHVDPSPELPERLADLLAAALQRFAEEWQQENVRQKPAMLGADPEFALRRSDGHFVSAGKFLERDGRAGSDTVIVRGGTVLPALAELRPEPSADPLRLTQHLRSAMLDAAQQIGGDTAWLAGGMPAAGLPLGGHIHFSGMWLSSGLLRALDNYLALPLLLLESGESRRRRPRYGFLGDFRRKPHGGFEYRTLPSWLWTSRRAEGVLCLARLIADHYRELKQRPLSQPEVQRIFYEGDSRKLLPHIRSLWSDVERVWSYYAYQEQLSELKADILRLAAWKDGEDIRPHWKIPPIVRKEPSPAGFML